MTFEKIYFLLKSSTTVKLLRADNAPLIISALFHIFNNGAKRDVVTETEFLRQLGDFLLVINQDEVKYPNDPKEYLNAWTADGAGYLRRYPENDDLMIELTPPSESALKWIAELDKPEWIGTESRLKYLIEILQNLAVKSNPDQELRISDLKKQKKKIEEDLEKAERGEFEQLDDRQIKEQYFLAEETARKLLGDFRQVEQNLRELDRDFRKTIITSVETKGKVLTDLFKQQDYLWETNQGKSFKAFWEFLLLQNQLDNFDKIVNEIQAIDVVKQIETDNFRVDSLKNNLISAGSKANRTTGSLLEQLRRYLEHKSFFENKAVYENINSIFEHILEMNNDELLNYSPLAIEDVVRINLINEPMPLFSPRTPVKFKKQELAIGHAEGESQEIYNQLSIDFKELRNNIKEALRTKAQFTLKELLETYAVQKGMAEVVGYIEIALKNDRNICDFSTTEDVLIKNVKSKKQYLVSIPKITFK